MFVTPFNSNIFLISLFWFDFSDLAFYVNLVLFSLETRLRGTKKSSIWLNSPLIVPCCCCCCCCCSFRFFNKPSFIIFARSSSMCRLYFCKIHINCTYWVGLQNQILIYIYIFLLFFIKSKVKLIEKCLILLRMWNEAKLKETMVGRLVNASKKKVKLNKVNVMKIN